MVDILTKNASLPAAKRRQSVLNQPREVANVQRSKRRNNSSASSQPKEAHPGKYVLKLSSKRVEMANAIKKVKKKDRKEKDGDAGQRQITLQKAPEIAEDIKKDFRSYSNLTPNVSSLNKLLQRDFTKFNKLTKPNESKDEEIKNVDVKEILFQAKKELRTVEHYANRIVSGGLENSVNLKVTSRE